MNDLDGFLDYVSHNNFSETEMAIYIAFWLIETSDENSEIEFSRVVKFINENRLKNQPNESRLRSRLKADRGVIFSKDNHISFQRVRANELRSELSEFLQPPKPSIQQHLIDESILAPINRKYIQNFAKQINACFQFQSYDACAVMMRRLVEVLIVEAFERKNAIAEISEQDGSIVGLERLIGHYSSGRHWKPSRISENTLKSIKLLGDTAAHDRRYETKSKDIEDVKQKFRILVEEQAKIICEQP